MAGAAKARKTRHGEGAADASRRTRKSRRYGASGARVSTGSQDTTSDADEGDDDESMERHDASDDDAVKAATNGKRKRTERTDGEVDGEETEDEEPLMETQTEASQSEKKRTEMGVIEEIYCENFMCHRKLRVQLSPHINFITGENGSGKSAIIAAIQICLGASARSTHRGKSIKNLIRHGHDGNALVRITLRNDADKDGDAFRPKQFGKKIIVERLIRRDGSAEYRLKNEQGVLVSKLKNDLDAMLDHLNIQTENPCAILDQENAKLFLKGNPTDKYKFFLQSTDLYKMRNTYGKIDEETRNMSESVLRREKVKVAALKEAMEEAVQRWEEAQSIGMLEAEFVQVKKELAWSFVHEKELEAEKVAKNLRMKQKDEEQVREEYEGVKEMVQALENKLKQKTNELEDMNSKAKSIQRRKEEAKNAIREARRPLHSHNAELKQIRQQRERTTARIQRLQRDIETKRKNHDQMIRTRMQRNDEMRDRIERKRNEVAHLEREVEEARHMANLRDLEDGIDQQHEECVRMLRETEHDLSRLEGRLSGLRSQKRDSLAVYGNKIPQLQQLIHDNMHRFTAPPIGPLGMFVKLPERFMHLAVAIEVALKGTLHSYLVVNGKDKALLDELKRRIKCPPNQATIIIAKRSGRRYSNLRVPEGPLASHAICNVLEVNDDEVFNALIDVCNTESKLLFDDKATAEREVLRGVSGSWRMASNYITEVYLKNGDRFMVRKGNLAYIANKKLQRSSVICQDVEGEIRDLEKRLDYMRGTYDKLRRDDSRFRQQRDDAVREARRQSERFNELTRRFNQRRVELRSLEDELADDVQQNALDTSVLEDEVTEAKREMNAFDDREAELMELLSRHNPDLDGLVQVLEDLRAEEEDRSGQIAELQEDVDAVYKHLSEVKVQELRFEREAATCGEFVVKWQANLVRLQQECDELSEKAKVVCESDERIEVSHTHDFYGKRLTDIKRKIDQERSRFQGMDLNDLQMDKEEKTLKYTAKKNTFDLFAGNVEMIRTMLDERKRVWHILRKEIAQRTSVEFNKYMNINSFAGKLRFRHDDQRLEIAVLHNDKGVSRKSQVTDMKELSGGERSYTQVSLLLALGESIECPFRVMDEFDVFMDSVNRDMTIQLLVDAAKKDCNKQFIFVTPNDLSALRRDPMVKIQKMDPPRDRLNAEQQGR